MLRAAPKGRAGVGRPLEAAEDRLLRAAFGRFGGSASARADAVAVVRRYQLEAGGHWFHCDCRPGLVRPPVLVPVMERFVRRHVQAGWPPHDKACDFFREPAEQEEITASYSRLLDRSVRLVRTFDHTLSGSVQPHARVTQASPRPRLARLLTEMMTQAGLQSVSPDEGRPPLSEQLRRLWPVARGFYVDRDVRLSEVLCLSLSRLPALVETIATMLPGRFARTRPHGLLLVRLADVRGQELVTLGGQTLPIVGRVAVCGEAPVDEPDPPGACSPYLALCVVARPAPEEPVQLCSAYAHSCLSAERLLLVDSDLERRTLSKLIAFQKTARDRYGLWLRVDKPLHDIGPPRAAGAPSKQALIPDFLVTAENAGRIGRRVIVETMGYPDEPIGRASSVCILRCGSQRVRRPSLNTTSIAQGIGRRSGGTIASAGSCGRCMCGGASIRPMSRRAEVP